MILLTGATGFIGKHLTEALVREYGPDQLLVLSSKPVKECACLLHHEYSFDDDYFGRAGYVNIHTIIHAGAFTPKNGSQANDRKGCNGNIYSTDKLLNAKFPGLKKIIYLSTLDVYGNSDIISEGSLIQPVSLYGHSKLYCEKMVAARAQEGDKLYQVLRVGHVYGPGEEAYQKIIPVTIKKILAGEPVEIWGTGAEIRSFIYIKDVVRAILQSLKLENSEGPINLVSSQKITMGDLIEKLMEISGTKADIKRIPVNTPSRNLVFDNGRMKSLLLKEETPLEFGLKMEWEHMKNLL